MFRPKSILWITFAFCVSTGSCTDFVRKSEGEVLMDCAGATSNSEIVWKFNDTRLVSKNTKGNTLRGPLDGAKKAQIIGTSLKMPSLKKSDAGVYKCGSSMHRLYIASANANPSTVLHSEETKLSCSTYEDFKGIFEWHRSKTTIEENNKEVTLKSVTLDDAGSYTCKIKNQKGDILVELDVHITVVGPLQTLENVTASEGGKAELPCFLPAPAPAPASIITGGSWTRNSPSEVLLKKVGSVQWNSTNGNNDKFSISEQNLNHHFNMTLKKVKLADAGVYVCSLKFEGGKSLSAKLTLMVTKSEGAAPGTDSQDSKGKKTIMHKRILGMQVWIWIAVAASALVLIILVVIVLLIYRRNKRMKRKMKRLKSMQQPLTFRNYCQCERSVRTARQPGTGKRERPPPLPRHQYSSLNQ